MNPGLTLTKRIAMPAETDKNSGRLTLALSSDKKRSFWSQLDAKKSRATFENSEKGKAYAKNNRYWSVWEYKLFNGAMVELPRP